MQKLRIGRKFGLLGWDSMAKEGLGNMHFNVV